MSSSILSSRATTSNTVTVVADTQIVDEIPDTMKRLASWIVRTFYGVDFYIVMETIKRSVCIKEEALRELTRMDTRQLRTILMALRSDKLIKERQVVEQRPDGRQTRCNYYFVNYRSIVNVTKYKLDHMRSKLESREKDNTHRACYKCSGCSAAYTSLDIDRLFDAFTGELKCWLCQSLVDDDKTAGPSDQTRTMLAKFNDQMTPLFTMLRMLDGVQLAPHLLEPSLATAVREKGSNTTMLDASASNTHSKGERNNTGQAYEMYKQQVTVHIGDQATSAAALAMANMVDNQPAWLTHSTLMQQQINAAMNETAVATEILLQTTQGNVDRFATTTTVTTTHASGGMMSPTSINHDNDVLRLLQQHENVDNDSVVKMEIKSENDNIDVKQEASSTEDDSNSSSSDDDEDNDEPMVNVGGIKYRLTHVQSDSNLVAKMSASEKAEYVQAFQKYNAHFDDY